MSLICLKSHVRFDIAGMHNRLGRKVIDFQIRLERRKLYEKHGVGNNIFILLNLKN